MARPEFTIIAGPNGAGKSTLCPFYVSTTSFDGDKMALSLRQEHPDWPERWITGTVISTLEKLKNEAIQQKKSFAFETNYSSEYAKKMLDEFKAAGFKISLCYFGLQNEQESISRVIHRKMNGGHDVDNNVIHYNFQNGKEFIKKDLDKFENLTFVENDGRYGKIVAMHISKGNIHEIKGNPPQWFKEQFYEAFQSLTKKDVTESDAVKILIERTKDFGAKSFSSEQITILNSRLSHIPITDRKEYAEYLWNIAESKMKGIVQEWKKDAHKELLDLVEGKVRDQTNGLKR